TDPDPDDIPGGTLTSPFRQYYYDQDGNQTDVVDALGHDTRTIYDVRDRPFQVIQALPTGTPDVKSKEDSDYTSFTGVYAGHPTVSNTTDGYESVFSGSTASATYSFTDLDPAKKYQVEVRWTVPDSGSYATKALFQVLNASGTEISSMSANLNSQ